MNWNFQSGIHPDADQLSVFVEGATTAREHERMLAHLAECAKCRKAVFLMQPHEQTQRATAMPVKSWVWRRLLPAGLPSAALACVLIALLIHFRPRTRAPEILQQNARVIRPEIQLPRATVAPTRSSESVARSENPSNGVPLNPVEAKPSPPEKQHLAGSLNLPKSNSRQTATSVEPPQVLTSAPPPRNLGRVIGGPIGAGGTGIGSGGGIGSGVGGAFRMQASGAAAAQNGLDQKKDLPSAKGGLEQNATLAGLSGHITDRSGAVVAGATVTLRDASGRTRQTTTGTDGSFHLTELPAGQYELIATASGFQTSKQSIGLKPSELAMLQPVLEVGTSSEAVAVEAASGVAGVKTEPATVGGTITEKEVTNLALNGRNFTQLVPILPATVSHGKRFLSLDNAGNLFLSRDGGKKWKEVNPQWAGKAVRIELTPLASTGAAFQMTTDRGAVWTSKDGTHWHQR